MGNVSNASGWEHSRALALLVCHWFLTGRVSPYNFIKLWNLLMILHNNIIQGCDSSFSIYNANYKQSYHSKSLGAYTETLLKHIYPSLFFQSHGSFCKPIVQKAFLQHVDSMQTYYKHNATIDILPYILQTFMPPMHTFLCRPLRILDICFGLGYNAMLSLAYFKECEIYSPEKDYLLQELCAFPYHNIPYSKIVLHALHKYSYYKRDKQILYYLYGDALTYLAQCKMGYFDIVFQDAFSQQHNPELWDISYFQKLYYITKSPCIITTYAKARCVLEAAKAAGFYVLKYAWGSIFFK